MFVRKTVDSILSKYLYDDIINIIIEYAYIICNCIKHPLISKYCNYCNEDINEDNDICTLTGYECDKVSDFIHGNDNWDMHGIWLKTSVNGGNCYICNNSKINEKNTIRIGNNKTHKNVFMPTLHINKLVMTEYVHEPIYNNDKVVIPNISNIILIPLTSVPLYNISLQFPLCDNKMSESIKIIFIPPPKFKNEEDLDIQYKKLINNVIFLGAVTKSLCPTFIDSDSQTTEWYYSRYFQEWIRLK